MWISRGCVAAGLFVVSAALADDSRIEQAAVRAAIDRALPLLQRGAQTFRERSEGRCISCHHQGLILTTVALARAHSFTVDEQLAREEVNRVHGFYQRRLLRYREVLPGRAEPATADPFGNFTVHAGYWLWGLAAEKVPPDEATEVTARLLVSKQWEDGRWSYTDTARAPMQAGDFAPTALAALALKQYGAASDKTDNELRLARAQTWLVASTPKTTDDHAFRLLGLLWTTAPVEHRAHAARQLLALQRPDGGWGQQPNMPPDPYATGLSLMALYWSDELRADQAAYQRGSQFLLSVQRPDGSWFVKTRAIPTNPYFESGFPHAKSQFISYAGTCWATMALLVTVPAR